MPTAAAPVRPAFDGAWVGGLVPGLLGPERPDWLPAPAADARAVVLLVLDGLGWRMLEEHRTRMPTLAGLDGGPVTTVAPSTTSAALTSISTGLAPAAHGIVGFRIRVGGEILGVLSWLRPNGERGPDPAVVQPRPCFLGQAVPVVTRSEFRDTGFTQAHLRGTRLLGWSTPAVLTERCRRLIADGERFVYGYYDGVDKVAHEYGLRDGYLAAELAATDRLVADLLAALPTSCALIVTSDHGQVHVRDDAKHSLEQVAPMVAAYSGEGRFRSLHARAGARADLLDTARDAYGDKAWVFERDRLFDEGWLGPDASLEVRGRVGDVVLAAREPCVFIAPDYETEARLVSYHGSLTAEEMLVPLLAGRGTA